MPASPPSNPRRDPRPLPVKARKVVEKLRKAGFEAWWVGGCVRDKLLGVEPHEYDITTSATPDEVMALFRRTVPVGKQFGVVRVRYGGEWFEVATFRADKGYTDGRRPDAIEFVSAREDVLRRDFTVNGLLMDPVSGKIVDWVGGRDDLARRIVRAIGDPHARFAEDRLRMLRAVRFAARLGFDIEPATWKAIRTHAPAIVEVSRERIRDELLRIARAGGPRFRRGVELLEQSGLLEAIFGSERAGLLAAHGGLERALEAVPASDDALAALGTWWFRLGERGAERQGRDLVLSNAQIAAVAGIVRVAGSAAPPAAFRDWDLAERKRFVRDVPRAQAADAVRALGAGGLLDESAAAQLETALRTWTEAELFPPRLVRGGDLIAQGYRPGPDFKRALGAVEDAQLRGEVNTRDEALALAVAKLEELRSGGPTS